MQTTSIGSSVVLMQELEELNEHLKISERWDFSEGVAGGDSDDPLIREANQGWRLMEGFARASLQSSKPICFDG